MKPFLSNKGYIAPNAIILEENGKLVSNEEELVEIFNSHYIIAHMAPEIFAEVGYR